MGNISFTSEFFAGNRQRLRELFMGTAPIVISANGLLQKASDEAYPFHQDRSFWYLTGIDEPDAVLVMDKAKEYIILPQQGDVKNWFDGAIDLDLVRRISGIEVILDEKEGWKQLEARLHRVHHVATLAANPKYMDAIGLYANPARAEVIRRMQEVNPKLELLDLRPHITRMRMVKQPVELAAIQEAIDITLAAIKESVRRSKLDTYEYEYELEAEFARGIRRRGATGHAFEPIVAGGPRACILHNTRNMSPLKSGELIVMDVGAEYSHYAADITRTLVKGKATKRQRDVVEAVNTVLEFGINQLKPGASYTFYEQQLRQFMGEKLRKLGLIKSISEESIRQYYPHAPHFLGLDVHDAGDYQLPLESNMVVTIEPGIYIPKEGIGVRIEEDVLITENGAKVLSAGLPRLLI